MVHPGPAREKEDSGSAAERDHDRRGEHGLGAGDGTAGPGQPTDPPVQGANRGEPYGRRQQHRELGESPVVHVAEHEHRHPQHARPDPEVRLGLVPDAEALDEQLARGHVPVAVEQRLRLGVVEIAERLTHREVGVPVRDHPGEHGKPEHRTNGTANCESAPAGAVYLRVLGSGVGHRTRPMAAQATEAGPRSGCRSLDRRFSAMTQLAPGVVTGSARHSLVVTTGSGAAR